MFVTLKAIRTTFTICYHRISGIFNKVMTTLLLPSSFYLDLDRIPLLQASFGVPATRLEQVQFAGGDDAPPDSSSEEQGGGKTGLNVAVGGEDSESAGSEEEGQVPPSSLILNPSKSSALQRKSTRELVERSTRLYGSEFLSPVS